MKLSNYANVTFFFHSIIIKSKSQTIIFENFFSLRNKATLIVQSLTSLITNANLGELTSLEELVSFVTYLCKQLTV